MIEEIVCPNLSKMRKYHKEKFYNNVRKKAPGIVNIIHTNTHTQIVFLIRNLYSF